MLQVQDCDKGVNENDFQYPILSIVLCWVLIYLSPFISLGLNYIAFGIFIYRIIRYDESVFSIDYCSLAGVSYIFLSTGRVSLLAWLSIFAAVWYIVKNGIMVNASFFSFMLLFMYILLRMQHAYNSFVLCFSQILLLYVLISRQKTNSIPLCTKAFCGNVIFASIYALLFRNSVYIRGVLGKEAMAYLGSSQTRFQGLLRDPNYYMCLVAIAIVLIVFLYLNGYSSIQYSFVNICLLLFLGAITYSKTFILALVFLVIFLVGMLFYKKMYFQAVSFLCLIIGGGLLMAKTVLSVTIYRITSARNMHDLTTGRNDLILNYLKEVTKSAQVLFFGNGLSGEILRRGTHNIFLEIVFYFGLVGLLLLMIYIGMLIYAFKENIDSNPNGPYQYLPFLTFTLLFCTLQGITFAITYIMLYLTILAMGIVPRQREMKLWRKDEGKNENAYFKKNT